MYKNVSAPIVSVQKNPKPSALRADKNEVRLGSNEIEYVIELMTIVAVPQDKSIVVISHEYFVVAFTEY